MLTQVLTQRNCGLIPVIRDPDKNAGGHGQINEIKECGGDLFQDSFFSADFVYYSAF